MIVDIFLTLACCSGIWLGGFLVGMYRERRCWLRRMLRDEERKVVE